MKTQMEINTCKILPLFKISRTQAWKWPVFLDFPNSRLPLKKIPPYRENGYEQGIRSGREGPYPAQKGFIDTSLPNGHLM